MAALQGHLPVETCVIKGFQMTISRCARLALLVHAWSSGEAACPASSPSTWSVSDTASATALAEIVAKCPGEEYDVKWNGSVSIDRTIGVRNGTVLRIAGVEGESQVDGKKMNSLFFVSNASLHVMNMNLTNGNASFGGGAVTALSSVLTFIDVSFLYNVGATSGVLCAGSGSNVTWYGVSHFVGNTGYVEGGAVSASENSNVTWGGRSTFVENRCASDQCDGGAVYVGIGSTASWETEASFSNNVARGFGGAVFVEGSSVVSWKSTVLFTDNHAVYNGGAVTIIGSFVSWESEASFIGNTAAGFAGAVAVQIGSYAYWKSNVLFYNNTASRYAGAVLVANQSNVHWTGETLFFANTADVNGGALFTSYSSELILSGRTEFRSNHAAELGGAVGSLISEESEGSSSLFVKGPTTFVNNTCDGSGGAIFVGGSFSISFETPGIIFANNSAAISGGAMFITGVGVGLEIYGVRFVSNFAEVGGAVAVTSSGNEFTRVGNGNALENNPTTFRDCTFIGNFAEANGGAIYSAAGVDYIVDTSFRDNIAGVGGAMRLTGTSSLDNCSFVENSSEVNGGPAVSNIGLSSIANCSFVDNVFNCEEGYFLDFNTSLAAFGTVCDGCNTECEGCTWQAKVPLCTMTMANTKSSGGQTTIENLVIDNGYWRATNTSINIIECYNEGACLGGVTGSVGYCAKGYKGPYCSACSEGYASNLGYQCTKCSDRGSKIALAAVFIVIAVSACVVFVAMTSTKLEGVCGRFLAAVTKRMPMQAIKIVIVAWQILTQFATVTYITYPGIYNVFLDVVSVLNFDLSWALKTGCVFHLDFHDNLIVVTVAPIICVTILGVTYTLKIWKLHQADHEVLGTVRRKHLSAVLLLSYLIYSSVSSTLFQTFSCEKLDDGKEYLRADYTIECTSEKHKALEVYAGIMILLYPIGIPLFYTVLLFRHRIVLERGQDRALDERVRSFSDLWKPYRPGCFFYEVIECLRRILLTGFVVFIYPNTPAQIAISLMFAVLFIFISEILSPYASKWDTWVSRMGHAIVLSSLYLGLLLKVDITNERGNETFEGALVAANICLIVVVFIESVVVVLALWDEEREETTCMVYPRLRHATDASSCVSAED